MRIGVIGVIVVAGLSMGARDANAQRVLTAIEGIAGDPNNMTSATDSGHGAVCTTANEDTTACFGTAYNVNSSLINPTFRAAGGVVGVNLCDVLGATCALSGTDPNNTISDQLYLQVGAAVGGMNSLLWCWDSDLEPNVNICQQQVGAGGTTPFATLVAAQVLEPSFGFTDLTSFFAGPTGPLAAGQWVVRAESEVPEPASVLLFGSVVAVCALRLRKRKQVA